MPTEFEMEVAIAIMDQLTTRLHALIKAAQGFDNDSVIWMIKAWTKVGMLTHGDSFHKQRAAYYVMKRDPDPSTEKRSRTLHTALGGFETMLKDHKQTHGDHFQRADKAMLNFVWEYRKAVTGRTDKGKSEKEFVAFLMKWMSTSAEDAKKAVVAGVEQHL